MIQKTEGDTLDITDNALPGELFKKAQEIALGVDLPWHYTPTISDEHEEANGYYYHNFFVDGEITSNGYSFFLGLARVLLPDMKAIIRMRLNAYTRTATVVEHGTHSDFPFPHKGALLYMNTNDGFTRVGDSIVESVENRRFRHDPSEPHSSSSCTDQSRRIVLVVNYL